MSRTALRIGPRDHGRRMSLQEFDQAEAVPGHGYELSQGVVTVVDVPSPRHFAQVNALRMQLAGYEISHAGTIHGIAAGSECKLLIRSKNSERHPDLAIYKSPPPTGPGIWSTWVPEIVIEVVSPGSADRDYHEKREDYLAFGVSEYWIVDADRAEMHVLKRSRDDWTERVIGARGHYRTKLLPGFELSVAEVFEAAEGVE